MAVALALVPSFVFALSYGSGYYNGGNYNEGALSGSTIVLASGTNPSAFGASITLTATVSPSAATGTVTFKNSGTTIGSATLGHASGSLTTSALAAGSHSLTAVYSGNLTYTGSTSNTVVQVVTAPAASSSSSSGNSGSSSGGGGGGGGGAGGGYRAYLQSLNSGSTHSSAGESSSDSGTSSSSPSTSTSSFTDVPTTAWFASFVETLAQQGIVTGYKSARGEDLHLFGPNDSVQYDHIAKMVMLMVGSKESPSPSVNVSARGTWAEGWVAAAERKISLYNRALVVQTEAPRGAVVQTILEAVGVPLKHYVHTFSDVRDSNPYASALATGYALGLVTGYKDANGNPLNIVKPNDPITRAEAATLIVRAQTLDLKKLETATVRSVPIAPQSNPAPVEEVQPVNEHLAAPLSGTVKNISNLRAEPSLSAAILTALPVGTHVMILGQQAEWTNVKVQSGMTGYVITKNIEMSSSSLPEAVMVSPPESTPTTSDTTGTERVITGINVRTEPSSTAKIIAGLPENARVAILEIIGDWAKILFDEVKTGYVVRKFLSAD
ncbi:MAG: SH3 domain-containing protein [Candidatus Peribacteraceae bacterium]|nr:SH3 domain-containing protein [Candidatus Peribacteraceae bacterium]